MPWVWQAPCQAMPAPKPLARTARCARHGGLFDIETLDPTLMDSQFQQNLHWQLRNSLIDVGPGSPIPELAESWEGSRDAKTWTFRLRKGVRFHNSLVLVSLSGGPGKPTEHSVQNPRLPILVFGTLLTPDCATNSDRAYKANGLWWEVAPWPVCNR